MFIGHFGLSFAAKKAAPKVSLAILFIATQFVDIVWPFLLISNVEKVAVVPGYTETNAFEFVYYPYTHSLLMNMVWGVITGILYWLFKRDKRGAVVVGLCVLSHWFLDLIVHTADLPLSPFSDYKVGFGLWNHVFITLFIETALFLVGVYIYATVTKAKNKIGKWGFGTLAILLLLFNFANTFGPTPSASVMKLFAASIPSLALIIAFAYWVDRNRELV